MSPKMLGLSLTVIAVLIVVVTVLTKIILPPLCSNTIRLEQKSPGGKYVATFFERDCGATTDFADVVTLRSASDKFKPKNGIVLSIKGHSVVQLEWKSDEELVVRLLDVGEIFRQDSSWNEVKIRYLRS